MPTYSIGQAARLLGVSPETVRRWADGGLLPMGRDGSGNQVIDGVGPARFAKERAVGDVHGVPGDALPTSVRNAFTGIVTTLAVDDVVAPVEVQAGPHQVVACAPAPRHGCRMRPSRASRGLTSASHVHQVSASHRIVSAR